MNNLGGWILTRALFALSLLTAGCMDNPRNGQTLTSAKKPFMFSGYTPVANDFIDFKAFRPITNTFVSLSNGARSASKVFTTDVNGEAWYDFANANETIPLGPTGFWKKTSSVGSQRRLMSTVMGVASSYNLATFDTNPTCDGPTIYKTQGGDGVVAKCASSRSPQADVFLNCGQVGQDCCMSYDATPKDYCDSTGVCGTANTCIAAGATGQPCKFDGGCAALGAGLSAGCLMGAAPAPYPNVCKDTTIDHAPVVTSEVVIHTCDLANADTIAGLFVSLRPITYGKNSDGALIPVKDTYYLDQPGANAARNSTGTYAVSFDDISTISDIKQLVLGVVGSNTGDDWCVDDVQLLINGTKIFEKKIPAGARMYAGLETYTFGTDLEMRNYRYALPHSATCAIPKVITLPQLQRKVSGMMGDLFVRAALDDTTNLPSANQFKAWWGTGGVTTTVTDPATVRFDLGYRAQHGFYVTVKSSIAAHFGCTSSVVGAGGCAGSPGCSGPKPIVDSCSTNFDTNLSVLSVGVNTDTSVPVVDDLVQSFATSAVINAMADVVANAHGFDQTFAEAEAQVCSVLGAEGPILGICDAKDNICGCPGIVVNGNGVNLDWTHFAGNNNLTTVSDLMCLQ